MDRENKTHQTYSLKRNISRAGKIGAGIAFAGAVALAAFSDDITDKQHAAPSEPEVVPIEQIIAREQRTLARHLRNPDFSGERFAELYFGAPLHVELVAYNNVYFSAPDTLDLTALGETIAYDPDSIKKENTSSSIARGFNITPPTDHTFFSVPINQLRNDHVLEHPIGEYITSFTIQDLHHTRNEALPEDGFRYAKMNVRPFSTAYLYNQANFIVEAGDRVLQPLADSIVAHTTTPLEEAQKLLDFVSHYIEDNQRGVSLKQPVKKPYEVILSGEGDDGAKAILYSSLLQQRGIDHLLVFTVQPEMRTLTGHMSVAVHNNDVPSTTASFSHNDQQYNLVTFAPGFIIGEELNGSSLNNGMASQDRHYVQEPRPNSRLTYLENGRQLPVKR